jgi:hypothetical protein
MPQYPRCWLCRARHGQLRVSGPEQLEVPEPQAAHKSRPLSAEAVHRQTRVALERQTGHRLNMGGRWTDRRRCNDPRCQAGQGIGGRASVVRHEPLLVRVALKDGSCSSASRRSLNIVKSPQERGQGIEERIPVVTRIATAAPQPAAQGGAVGNADAIRGALEAAVACDSRCEELS